METVSPPMRQAIVSVLEGILRGERTDFNPPSGFDLVGWEEGFRACAIEFAEGLQPLTRELRNLADKMQTFIETQEAQQIRWGHFESSMTGADVLDHFPLPSVDRVDPIGVKREAVLRALAERHALIRLDGNQDIREWRFRSRIAEMVRLLRKVRQRFPDHRRHDESRRLVRDVKFEVRAREVPRRRFDLDDVVSGLADLATDWPFGPENWERTMELWRETLSSWGKRGFSQFQYDATMRIAEGTVRRSGVDATVVAAGTGSGKTLANFAPALLRMIGEKAVAGRKGVKMIAIYPRINLATNQVASFVAALHHLNQHLRQGEQPLTVGIDYGGVPYSYQEFNWRNEDVRGWKYDPTLDAYECPFLRCPICSASEMEADDEEEERFSAERGRLLLYLPKQGLKNFQPLRCADCGTEYPYVYYTRDDYARFLPDIYVATTESLNDRLMSPQHQALFGTAQCVPSLIMVDEIHLHTGLQGSHVGALLRRLRRKIEGRRHRHPDAVRSALQVIGLSATIAHPVEFFHDLTGVWQSSIHVIQPQVEELEYVGAEYSIFVKPETYEETTILSTLIQATMVLNHTMLQPGPADGVSKYRTFGFVNAMDVKNRWYTDMKDAESELDGNGQARTPLYRLRDPEFIQQNAHAQEYFTLPVTCSGCPAHPDPECILFREGECWWPMRHGGNAQPLKINEVSSEGGQPQGQDDLVIATSSLEVGYDDDAVMAVIQYQAPTDVAAYVQRKGRGGRQVGTRPAMLTVLSPYRPRDVFYYRNHHLLLDPTFKRLPLNPTNQLLRQVHALYAIFDWAAEVLYGRRAAKVAGPAEREAAMPWLNRQGLHLLKELTNVRTGTDATGQPIGLEVARSYVQSLFEMTDQEVAALLGDPKGVLQRGLIRLVQAAEENLVSQGRPRHIKELIPTFLPPNFFTELNLPETVLKRSEGGRGSATTMKVDQALREAMPGRANRRWRGSDAYWVPPAPLTPVGLHLQAYDPSRAYEPDGSKHIDVNVSELPDVLRERFLFDLFETTIPVWHPQSVILEPVTDWSYSTQSAHLVPGTLGIPLSDRTNAVGVGTWVVKEPEPRHSHLIRNEGEEVGRLGPVGSSLFQEVRLFDCAAHLPLSVKRVYLGADWNIALEPRHPGEPRSARKLVAFRQEEGRQAVALGYELQTDGLSFVLREDWVKYLGGGAWDLSQWRHQILRHRVLHWADEPRDAESEAFNVFTLDLLLDLYLRFRDNLLEEQNLSHEQLLDRFVEGGEVLEYIVERIRRTATRRRTRDAVLLLLKDEGFRRRLAEEERYLLTLEPAELLGDLFLHSLKHAMKQAAQETVGAEAADQLGAWVKLDRDFPGVVNRTVQLFEHSMYGNGTMKALHRRLRRTPHLFWDALDQVSSHCEIHDREAFIRELLTRPEAELAEIASLAWHESHLALPERQQRMNELRRLMRDRYGVVLTDQHLRILGEVFARAQVRKQTFENWQLYRELNHLFLDPLRARLGREPGVREVQDRFYEELVKQEGDYPAFESLWQVQRDLIGQDVADFVEIVKERMQHPRWAYRRVVDPLHGHPEQLEELIAMDEAERLDRLTAEPFRIPRWQVKRIHDVLFAQTEDIYHIEVYWHYANGTFPAIRQRLRGALLAARVKEEIEKRLLNTCVEACPDCLVGTCELESPFTGQHLLSRRLLAQVVARAKASWTVDLTTQEMEAEQIYDAVVEQFRHKGTDRVYVRYRLQNAAPLAQALSRLRVHGVPLDPVAVPVMVGGLRLAQFDLQEGSIYEVSLTLKGEPNGLPQ